MSTLRDIGEDALIGRLTALMPRDPAPLAGPGDDCAVVDPGAAWPALQLLKTDALVCGVHYLPDAPAKAVGWKAVARVISDFAAMGGQPDHFLVTLALPAETEVKWVEDLYRGMGDCLNRFGGYLAGGETSSIPAGSAAVISIAATGRVERDQVVLRSTGRAGDALMVTGRLGGSIHGKHLHFTPRIREAAWLVKHFKPRAMMDLSDGLAKDLPRMAAASGTGWRLDEPAVPLTPDCTLAQALGDGEDFELLFAVDPSQADDLLTAWPFSDVPLTRIGSLERPDSTPPPVSGGWEHFRSSSSPESC